jgi:hypothetical protein
MGGHARVLLVAQTAKTTNNRPFCDRFVNTRQRDVGIFLQILVSPSGLPEIWMKYGLWYRQMLHRTISWQTEFTRG